MPDDYRVQLDVFAGPLDLLLYLIRRDELAIEDISITRVTEQYLDYVQMLERLDPNAAGEFLVLASTLIELKSRALLPSPPLDVADDEDDPRSALVRQLLEYKRFKDAARALGTAAAERAERFVRQPADLPTELRGVELEDVEVWDLLTAFDQVMRSIGRGPAQHKVRYDDTPIEDYAADILARLARSGPLPFHALFHDRRERDVIVGLFLALLELIRACQVRAEQDHSAAAIYLFLLVPVDPDAPPPLLLHRAEAPADDEWAQSTPEEMHEPTE